MWTDSRHRLYRDPRNGIVAGVCAGLAEYFGLERAVVRLAFVVALVLFIVPALLAYIALAFMLPTRPQALFASGEEAAFWRGLNTAPDDALTGLRRRFGDLEKRLRLIERQVTSDDFDLHRKFRDLGR